MPGPGRTLGPIQVMNNSVVELNRALQELVDRIDGLSGLRGPVTIVDRLTIQAPQQPTEAATLANVTQVLATSAPQPVGDGAVVGTATTATRADHVHAGVSLTTAQSITGTKTFTGAPIRFVDENGTLIHAVGTKT